MGGAPLGGGLLAPELGSVLRAGGLSPPRRQIYRGSPSQPPRQSSMQMGGAPEVADVLVV
eukprot:3937727-Rhodomonas_salina.2